MYLGYKQLIFLDFEIIFHNSRRLLMLKFSEI